MLAGSLTQASAISVSIYASLAFYLYSVFTFGDITYLGDPIFKGGWDQVDAINSFKAEESSVWWRQTHIMLPVISSIKDNGDPLVGRVHNGDPNRPYCPID